MNDLSKTGLEMIPTVKTVGVLTIRALDSLPLPLLVVVFLACLALLQWPMSQTPSLLPTFTPPSVEKDRLSPLPLLEKTSNRSFFTWNSGSNTLSASLQVYSPALCPMSASGTVYDKQSLTSGRGVRRGSKSPREWRMVLGVVEEVEPELERAEAV
ncbi:hypothetical protein I317_07939 [Kwoniella heveanensis CBS 569]|uniref:Uncharacterized protein n=1 Tax=Kwoniella heveanensis BCC8398 TaxID=1296120 RepID=A0A1B9H244_9TREE|nr:hypothetical protein I316_00469 [Kwoniella heveanensis BCC8398]OCF38299.1 hypothetical protein I317_07939 [Kwoniella heveanensis CBS 569]